MHCPVCKTASLSETPVEEHLSVYCCATCAGTWIPSDSYWRWREQLKQELPELPPSAAELELREPDTAKICPRCRYLLLPYRIGHAVPFSLDHCHQCNGVWCDQGEWEVLRARNLHDNLHQMFGPAWQRDVHAQERRERLDAIYTSKFGRDDYAELQRIKRWLLDHPQQSALLAYLNDPDPYKR